MRIVSAPWQDMAIWLESAKMVPYHHLICLTSLWVQPMPKVSITVVATAMRVIEKAQKRRKMARIWPFLSHRRWFMAPKLFSHQCLLAPIFGAIFSTFGYLEVPFNHNPYIVLRMSWKEPAPLKKSSFPQSRIMSPFINQMWTQKNRKYGLVPSKIQNK